MAGVKKLRKIQIGKESTPGNNIDATTIWRGTGVLEDTSDFRIPDENVGYLGGVDRICIPAVGGQLAVNTEATFEQLPYILNAGVKGVAGVKDGAGTGYVYTYVFPTTSANTPYTYTIEGGDDQQAEEMAYGFVTDFSLSGSGNEPVMMAATWIGRQLAPGTFKAALSVPSVYEAYFNKASLAIDASGGTIGNTNKANTLVGFTLNVDTGFRPVYSADSQIYFYNHKQIGPEITCDIRMEHNATAVAEIAAWRAETKRLIRIDVAGPSLTTSGTYTTKLVRIDMAGIWQSFGGLEDMDGNDVVTGTFRSIYSSADTLYCQIVVVNELSALP